MARKSVSSKKAARSAKQTTRKEAPSANIKPQKPIFPVGPLITVSLLAVLIGFAFYLNYKKGINVDTTPTSEEAASVFPATDGTVSSIEIESAEGESVRIARNDQNVWALEKPTAAEADQGLAEAAATQVNALQIKNTISGNPDIFGLDNPTYTITIEFADGKKHTLEIGDSTPTNSGYYVRVDNSKIIITDLSGIDALLQLLHFPPFLNTPTPLPPTESLVSPTETGSSNVPTVTPQP